MSTGLAGTGTGGTGSRSGQPNRAVPALFHGPVFVGTGAGAGRCC